MTHPLPQVVLTKPYDKLKFVGHQADCYHTTFFADNNQIIKGHFVMTTPPIKVLVADEVSDTGLQPLRDAGFSVAKRTKLEPAEMRDALSGCAGLVVRSETKVTADLMDSATTLRVVGRAGVGVDNIDVPAATERGIVVMNAPDGNTITTAEHTIALDCAGAPRSPGEQQSEIRQLGSQIFYWC